MDHLDPEHRSENMRRVRGKDTRPELTVRRALHALGRRFRLHRRDLPGKPDIVLAKDRLAIFVHGCFWHRHDDCPRASTPSTRKEFWVSVSMKESKKPFTPPMPSPTSIERSR